ncbi:hypothetical protein [Sorangium cellulosum]|uniref:Uncharacterized protein n=1 Tax=Sorangium cellulosum TaxID=56 RepID=A0A150QN77_SORCE|nr:hypothetical protein [Sorangium cellulosum]KYF69098.1 hypothetical protein BE15_21085 [Sorangium cellulosum]
MSPRRDSTTAAVRQAALLEGDPSGGRFFAPVVESDTITDEERDALAKAADGTWIPHEKVVAEVSARRP